MKYPVFIILLYSLFSISALAQQERPEWAFPSTDEIQPDIDKVDPDKIWTSEGSLLALTRDEINDIYNLPDWYPDMYPQMPKIIQHGNEQTGVRACGTCHFPTGTGLDENAYLAALPVNYLIRQMVDYKSGDRKASGSKLAIAKAISNEEVREAAEYFASLEPRKVLKVVETDTVPRTYVAQGNKTLRHPDGGTEPIGNRIIQIPENEEMVLNRNPRAISIAYVPRGSIDRGKELVTTGGGGKTVACGVCHGETLRGAGDVPPLAGRHPNYIVRQLWNMQDGTRVGPSNAIMKPVVDNLSVDDMLAISAYTATLDP